MTEFPIWLPDGNILVLLATFEAACQPGPFSETNKLSSVYCISFQAALSTLNLAMFQSNQNPISHCANSICYISILLYAEEVGEKTNLKLLAGFPSEQKSLIRSWVLWHESCELNIAIML